MMSAEDRKNAAEDPYAQFLEGNETVEDLDRKSPEPSGQPACRRCGHSGAGSIGQGCGSLRGFMRNDGA